MTTSKRVDRKAQIMAAAAEVFSELGFERASTRAIAKRAGVAEGTIFNYFPTKRDILVYVLECQLLDTIPQFEDSDDAETVLSSLLESRLQMWKEHSGIMRVMVSEGLFDEQFRDLYRDRIYTPAMMRIGECIERLQKNGSLIDADPKLVSRMMQGVVLAYGLMTPMAREIEDSEALSRQLTQIMLQGLSPRKPEPI